MKRCIVIYLLFFSFPMLHAQTFYVSANATGGGNGSFNNEWTIYEAVNNVSAGDSVFVKMGQYNITSKLSFDKNGTASNPIVFAGEYTPGYDPKTVNGNGSSYFFCTYSNNGSVTINGDFIKIYNIVMEHTQAKQIINVYGDYNTFDGCVIKYPPNSAGDHTVIIKPSAQNFTLRNSFVWNSGRTIIWVESNSSDAADNALFEYNTFTGASNHYDIQIMPITTAANPPDITGLIIRNNIFIDNPYEAAIYLRQVSDFKIYNNLFINSGAPVHYVSHEVGQDSVNTKGSLIVYNTIYDVTHSRYWFRNAAANQLIIKNNLFVFDDGFGSSDITMDYRCFSSQPSNLRMQIDHNSYYFIGSNILNNGTAYWSNFCNNSSYSGMQNWKNATGFEDNGIFHEQTTFKDPANFDYTPVEGSAVINAGTPIGDIITDFYGNPRNPNNPTIGAFEFVLSGPDTIPPEVVNAELIDSITLKIVFSEVLAPTGAQNINNYEISNNITVTSAFLSTNKVILTTSTHSPGFYSVTVNNVTDLAGNIINQNSNSAEYERVEDPPTELMQLQIMDAFASVIPEPDHHPGKTFDGKGYFEGDPDSRWAGDTMPEWIAFDLGASQMLEMTKLEFYNWNSGRIYEFSVQVSQDNINWTEILSNVSSIAEQWTIHEFEAIPARYVKIIYHDSNQNEWAGLWEIELWGNQATSIQNEITAPNEFILEQNYPNPFNPNTKIVVKLPQSTKMRLAVYNLLGELVSEIANGEFSSGRHEFIFDATSGLTSGIYFYRLESPTMVKSKKMMLLR